MRGGSRSGLSDHNGGQEDRESGESVDLHVDSRLGLYFVREEGR